MLKEEKNIIEAMRVVISSIFSREITTEEAENIFLGLSVKISKERLKKLA